MTIDTERLKTDAAYWRECGAPEDATAAIENGWVKYDFDGVSESWFWWPFDHQMKQGWRKTLTQCDTYHAPFIPRPKGAPDTELEYGKPFDAEYEAILPDGTMAFYRKDGQGSWQIWGPYSRKWFYDGYANDVGEPPYDLEPIRTKEQRQKDDLADLIENHQMENGSFCTPENTAEAILSRYNLEPKP